VAQSKELRYGNNLKDGTMGNQQPTLKEEIFSSKEAVKRLDGDGQIYEFA
jgi:hypothetical protein